MVSNITIQTTHGDHDYISDNVYNVTTLHNNILNLGLLLEKGYDIYLRDLALTIRNKEIKVGAKVNMTKNELFTPNIMTEPPKCLNAIFKDSSWLWHLLFGYLTSLNESIVESKMVNYIPQIRHQNPTL